MENDAPKELQEFVREAISQLLAGSKGHTIAEPVEFEVAVTKVTTTNGKLGFKVIGIGGAGGGMEVRAESVSKIKFKISVDDGEPVGAIVTMGGPDIPDRF